MEEKKAWYLEYKTKFANKWVAKNKATGDVVDVEKTLHELAFTLAKKASPTYVIEKVLPPDVVPVM